MRTLEGSMEAMAVSLAAAGPLSLLERVLDLDERLLKCVDHDQNTLLHIACSAGSLQIAQALIARGLSTEVQNASGHRAIDVASPQLLKAMGFCMPPSEPPVADPATSVHTNASLGMEEVSPEAVDKAAPLTLSLLPDDVLISILIHVDRLRQILTIREVCRRLKKLAESDLLWERLCWKHHKKIRSSVVAGSWREVYQEHHLMHAARTALLCEREAARRSGAPQTVCRQGMSATVEELFCPLGPE